MGFIRVKKMDKTKNIIRSDSTFHQQIIRKYQVEKRKYFRFPMMVFYKNLRRFLSQRNIIPANVRLYLKIVLNMDKVVTLKYHKVVERLLRLDQVLAKRTSIFSPGKSIFSQFGYLRPNFKKIQTSFISEPDTAFSVQSSRKRLQNKTLIQQILNYLQIGSQTPLWHFKESTALSVIETGAAFSRLSERERLQGTTPIHQIMNYLQIESQIQGVKVPSRKKLFFTTDSSTFYPQTTSDFSLDSTVNNHLMNLQNRSKTQIKNINVKNTGIYPLIQNNNNSLFGNKTPGISSSVNFLLNIRAPFNLSKSLFNTIFQKTSIKPIIKNYGYNIALGASNPSNHLITQNNNSIQNFGSNINSFVDHTNLNKTIYLQADSTSLIFSSQQTIEQKVEQIKKIALDVKKDVADKSISLHPPLDKEIQKHIDLNRISEQVYQLIERKITIEGERRGIL